MGVVTISKELEEILKHALENPTTICRSTSDNVENTCPICKGTGWETYTDNNGCEFGRICKCGCREKKILDSKLDFASIPPEFIGNSVSNFRVDIYHGARNISIAGAVKKFCTNYLANFDELQGKGIYMYSKTKGSGKTRMASSIANDLVSLGYSVRFINIIQLLDEIKASWNGKGDSDILKRIKNVPVLVLDEIGRESPKEWINEKFYALLNYRLENHLTTIFTSNCEMIDLKLDDIVVSRINKMSVPLPFPEESIRDFMADSENQEIYRKLMEG